MKIGNQAIELEFGSDQSFVPVRIENRLTGSEVGLTNAGLALVLEENGNVFPLINSDLRLSSPGQSTGESITFGLTNDAFGIGLQLVYGVIGHTIRLQATVHNHGSRDLRLRDAVLLQAETTANVKGQSSSNDFSLGDAGALTSDVLKRVDAHPLFIDEHLFVGIDWPVAENVVQGGVFRCRQFAGDRLAPGEQLTLRPLSIGASRPGELAASFLQHLKRLRGRETRWSSMYFDWLVHASEGLYEWEYERLMDYFELLHDRYGIRFDLFCADDGIFETRWETTFAEYRKQHEALFPHGFQRLSNRMKEIGTACGAWLGPDGFGETDEEEQRRIDTVLSLIREHHIGLLKLDVCVSVPLGNDPYRNERYMRKLERLVAACHDVNPDIIIINHRISTSPYILTILDSTLWMGAESYPDHYQYNDDKPRLFTRYSAYGRGEPTYYGAYSELLEDHGICFNGFMEGWQEELVVQSLGRALMLAPEIYGTMFLLPDRDYPDLAKILKLNEQFRGLLAHTRYDRETGDFIHSDGSSALLCLINDSWDTVTRELEIGSPVGLREESGSYRIVRHFPFHDGMETEAAAPWGGRIQVKLAPFQVYVLEISPSQGAAAQAAPVLLEGLPAGHSDRSSVALGAFTEAVLRPEDSVTSEKLRYTISSDPTEAQVLARSAHSQYEAVTKCREFFLDKLRKECYGIAANAWDGDPVTAWGDSAFWKESGNVWRLDLGGLHNVNRVEVTLTEIGPGPVIDMPKGRTLPRTVRFEVSAEAKEWHAAEAMLYYRRQAIDPKTIPQKLIADWDLPDTPVRYVRMHMNGVLVSGIRVQTRVNGLLQDIPSQGWKGNNLLTVREPQKAFTKTFTLDEAWEGRYAAVVIQLPKETKVVLKQEVAFVWLEAPDGRMWPATDASPVYPYNGWEGNANRKGYSWTFRVPLTPDMCGVPLTLRTVWYGPREEQPGEPLLPEIQGYLVAVK